MTNPVFEGDVFDEETPDTEADEFVMTLGEEDFLASLLKGLATQATASVIERAAERGITLTEDEVANLDRDQFTSLMVELDDPEGHRHYYDWSGDVWENEDGTPMNGMPYSVSAIIGARLRYATLEMAAIIDFLSHHPGLTLHPTHVGEVLHLTKMNEEALGSLVAYPTNPIHTESEPDLTAKMHGSFDKAEEYEQWLIGAIDAEVARRLGSIKRCTELFGEGKTVDEVEAVIDVEFPRADLGEPPA